MEGRSQRLTSPIRGLSGDEIDTGWFCTKKSNTKERGATPLNPKTLILIKGVAANMGCKAVGDLAATMEQMGERGAPLTKPLRPCTHLLPLLRLLSRRSSGFVTGNSLRAFVDCLLSPTRSSRFHFLP